MGSFVVYKGGLSATLLFVYKGQVKFRRHIGQPPKFFQLKLAHSFR